MHANAKQTHAGEGMSRKKPPASASDSRFEMVMVKRSLDAANAIKAGNNKSLITSVTMITGTSRNSGDVTVTPCNLAEQLALRFKSI